MDLKTFLLDGGGALVLLLTLVQISPIKINPWSALGRLIGKALNGDVLEKLSEIEGKVDALEKRDAQQDAEREQDKALDARRRILQFADEIRRRDRHSEEHFNNVYEDIKFYSNYCRLHEDFENDRAKTSIKIIEETYEKCVRENDFL